MHIWTFKDDEIFFNAKNNIVFLLSIQEMYSIGHIQFKLDGIITEFADIYAPLAQIWKTPAPGESAKKGAKTNHITSEEN